jgi:hypothetical protein
MSLYAKLLVPGTYSVSTDDENITLSSTPIPISNTLAASPEFQRLVSKGAAQLSIDSAGVNIVSVSGTGTFVRSTVINAPGATPVVATGSYDIIAYTGLATAITSMTANLSGTPVLGQKLMLGFKDAGSAEAITWGASFKSSGTATLLATTVAGKQHWVGLMYDGTVWVCMAVDATGY